MNKLVVSCAVDPRQPNAELSYLVYERPVNMLSPKTTVNDSKTKFPDSIDSIVRDLLVL